MTNKTIPEPRSVFAVEMSDGALLACSPDRGYTERQARALMSQRVIEFVERREPTTKDGQSAKLARAMAVVEAAVDWNAGQGEFFTVVFAALVAQGFVTPSGERLK